MPEATEAAAQSVVQDRFKENEILPLKGIKFRVVLVHEIGITLLAVGLTGREIDRITKQQKRKRK